MNKITTTEYFSTGNVKEVTFSDALESRIDSSRDYYGGKIEDLQREVGALKDIVIALCTILNEKGIFKADDVQRLVGYNFDVK